ncbi:MAG: carboxypeptidase regulatory-like domain-containing protein [Bryobacteraceae bacterium]
MFVGVLLTVATVPSHAQSLTTGGVSGNITDATGAVLPNSTVTLTDLDKGSVQAVSSNAVGEFRFSLLKPGHYMVSATAPGFEKVERPVEVSVGNVVTANLVLQLGKAVTTVEVSTAAPLVTEDPSQITTFTQQQMELLPSGGGDLTNIAFTAPGALLNVAPPGMSGYGNFTVNGLPGTSNLFTTNGENNMDPYFNINNSGASNLTLGSNEVQDVTITTNPYSGQYGQLSGAQVSYVTKSGTNQFHGNASYYWNGRLLNANDTFNNAQGAPTPFANANQWSDSIGGPIIKDKTFFFIDNEGLRFLLPNTDVLTVPGPQFASAVLANVTALEPNEAATYKKLFSLYGSVPGYSGASALPNTTACNSLTLSGFDPATQPCALQFRSNPSALATEWILAGRVDHRFSDNDQAYFRYKMDRGTQPSAIDPVSPNFDAISQQPSWDTQLDETHIFSPRATNSLMATLSYYRAQFTQDSSLDLSTFPYGILTSGTVPFTGFNGIYEFPQGRNITQYQFIDDFSYTFGSHNLKFGENFRRYDVSDHNFSFNGPGVYFGYVESGLQEFADGLAYQYRQSANQTNDVPIALWGLGMYAQDEWRVRPNFKLTMALRGEHNSNPVCQTDCFSEFKAPFASLASTVAGNGNVPYSADIVSGLHAAYPGVDRIDWSPRLGFSYSPGNSGKTVISGGIGIFYDNVAAGLVDDLLSNAPSSVAIRVRPGGGVAPFDPAGGAATFRASAQAFNLNESFNQISSTLQGLGSIFEAPSFSYFNGTLHSPVYQEWNLQIQRDLGGSYALILAYNGNHGIKIPYSNTWGNAYDPEAYGLPGALYPSVGAIAQGAPPNPSYGTVSEVQSGAVSNYNGATVTFRKRLSRGLAFDLNYTWSHNLDETSNGGIFPINTNTVIGTQISPYGLRQGNYGNSDYDIRHSLTGDWVYTPKYHLGNHLVDSVFGSWQLSGKIFLRSGLPFTVTDNNWSGAITNTDAPILAYPTGAYQSNCGAAAVNTPCLNAGSFVQSASGAFTGYPGISPENRNQFRGPGYFDIDMQLYKTFKLTERVTFGLGAQAFNVLNHPNYAVPDSGFGDPTFGSVLQMAGTPTSPYGNFLGFDSAPRLLQVTGKVTF